jgi:NAD(P)-dependent dehydrogenase (short-subunit alcohol dehydrogenase family)
MASLPQPDGVVITGASSGIGAACARHLDTLGFRVFAGIRHAEDGQILKQGASPRLTPILLDVTDAASIAEAAGTVQAAVGMFGLMGLVNNAGIGVTGPVEIVTLVEWRRQFEVNFFGAIATTQAFLPLLRRGRGRVVNMSSITGRAAMPYMSPYSASKHALEAVSDALRVELQPFGVHVAIIEPGAIATPIWNKSKREADEQHATWTPDIQRLYADGFTKVKDAAMKAADRAAPASLVAAAVEHALTAPRPKTRYLVGFDAKIRAILTALLPDRIQDRLLTWLVKLPRPNQVR